MRRSIVRHFLCLATIFGLSPLLTAEDSTQFRGPMRDGKSLETGLWSKITEGKPQLAWMSQGLGKGYASVSVVGNRIYTSGNSGKGQTVTALSTVDGKILWSTPITQKDPKHSYDGSRTTPTVDGNQLYAVASSGNIVCLNASDGNLLWSRDFQEWNGKMMSGWGFSESPLVDGQNVICTPGGDKGMVVALDKMTGKTVWAATLPDYGDEKGRNGSPLKDGAGYASIMISQGGGVKQYVQLVGRGVIGLRASDGKLLWRYAGVANATANIPTVLVDGDNIFCSTAYDTGSALLKLAPAGNDEVKLTEVYQLKSRQMQNKHGGMVLVDGYIYCGDGNGAGLPICIKMADGSIAWGPERAPGKGESSITYADGVVVFRRESGDVDIVKATPEKFTLLTTFKPEYQEGSSWSYPVISGGKLYLREQDKLMCYSLK
ncbi:MAG: PQQ-like beta-propeller repeat protein [Pirellulaceae bacterium]|nr:PQQ-like beta-propeller repeat protein [Pirellulaceae bacterium]